MKAFKIQVVSTVAWLAMMCATEADEQRPNILFAISDDQSWMHCGAYGDTAIKTPAFDRVAREGILFNHAFAAAPSCMPSRSALLTGRNIWELEEAGNLMGQLRAKFAIFPLLLKESGYQLAATGKTWGPGALIGYVRPDGSPDDKRGKYRSTSTELLTGTAYESKRLDPTKPGMSAVDYAANFEDFLGERDDSKPFFFWLGTHEPHQGYESGAWERAGKKLSDARVPGCFPEHPTIQGEFLDYALEIEHFDQHLGRAIAALEQRDLLSNTIIVVTSDHGNPMPRSKCNLYDTGARVPLAIRWPAKSDSGRVVDDMVNLADLAPTFLEMAGLEAPEDMTARSLIPIITSATKSGQ
ncbi:MAG: sulfatase, partial [Verrucomicrobiota bacterium]